MNIKKKRMCEEIWVKTSFSKYYEVSNFGNVRSIDRVIISKNNRIREYIGKVLKINYFKHTGYPYITIWENGKKKNCSIHRLVAISFIPNPKRKPQINHINGDKRDCRSINLEWATSSENIKHAHNTGLSFTPFGEMHFLYGKTGDQCVNSKLVLNTETGIFYPSAKEAASSIGMSSARLRDRLIGGVKNNTSFVYA